jgi:hypothetical protein
VDAPEYSVGVADRPSAIGNTRLSSKTPAMTFSTLRQQRFFGFGINGPVFWRNLQRRIRNVVLVSTYQWNNVLVCGGSAGALERDVWRMF